MHIILHALALFVVVQCVTVMKINYQISKLGDRSKTQHLTLEQLITAKISGNALKQESRTHSRLRQCSLQLQKQQALRLSRRIAVEQRRYAAVMADTQDFN